MNIGLVILHADPARGGAERYTVDLAQALARRHRVSLIAASSTVELPGVEQVRLRCDGLTRAGQYASVLDALDEHLQRTRYDVVHAALPVRRCDVYHPHAGLAVDAVRNGHRKRTGLARVASRIANRINIKRQRFAAVERELLRSERPPVVISLSDYVKGAVSRYYTLDRRYQVRLFNAVELERFDPARNPNAGAAVRQRFQIPDNAVVALMIAQDFQRKGLREAILALEQVRNSHLVLLVVGKQEAGPYRRLAEQRGLADRVIFAGETKDPYAFYQSADFFVLPTKHDPCSLVVLEALAMGLPVISTRFNGACEIMTDGHEGFVLSDPEDVKRLAGAMDTLADDSRRQEMSHAAMALRPQLSYEHHIDQLLEIYEQARRR